MKKYSVSALTFALCVFSAILEATTKLPANISSKDQLGSIEIAAAGTSTTIAQNGKSKTVV